MNSALKNFLIGVFVLTAIVLLFSTVMFLKPSVGDNKQTLYVRFSDINKINIGTRVMFAGKPVGEVVAIENIRDARNEPTDELGRVYFYQLTLKLDSHVHIYNTDEMTTQTSGLLGERSIAIIPKAPPVGVTPKLLGNQPIYANSVDPLENAIVEFSELSNSMEEAFNQVTKWIKTHGEDVATSVKAVGAASTEFHNTLAAVNQSELVDSVKAGADQFGAVLSQVNGVIDELSQKEMFANLAATTESLKSISQDISQGKGTIGKLVVDDDLYLSSNAILSKVNNLMNDVNNYGVLFHLNKRWQRLHMQRVDLQQSLETPLAFRTHFENEIDGIQASMGRLSTLINQPQVDNEQFKRDFAELLKQADQLSANLKLYNQQLLDLKGRQ